MDKNIHARTAKDQSPASRDADRGRSQYATRTEASTTSPERSGLKAAAYLSSARTLPEAFHHVGQAKASIAPGRSFEQRGPVMMNNSTHEFERLLGKAALALWSDFPRDVQESLFEQAVAGEVILRNHLASYLHDHHPKTAHPAKPTQLA
jgi:hypothetical protein